MKYHFIRETLTNELFFYRVLVGLISFLYTGTILTYFILFYQIRTLGNYYYPSLIANFLVDDLLPSKTPFNMPGMVIVSVPVLRTILLWVHTFRFLVPFFLVWSFKNIYTSWKRTIVYYMTLFFIAIGIIELIYYVIDLLLCNTSFYPQNICNDINYCRSFSSSQPIFCPDNALFLASSVLTINPTFGYLWIPVLIFLVGDVVIFSLIELLVAVTQREFQLMIYNSNVQNTETPKQE